MEWFYRISHLFMSPTKFGELLRHLAVVHDDAFIVSDPPVLSVHAAAMPQPLAPTATDVDMPSHVVV